MRTRRDAIRTFAAGLAVTLAPLPSALRAQEGDVLKRGMFEGASNHVTTGSGTIVTLDGKSFVSLGTDFSFDGGAPDVKIALGNDGYDPNTILGPLASDTGAQNYPIPETLDPTAYNEIWVWCEEFSVPLGVARLN